MEIKGFITNLGKYNEGELVGKWVTFPLYDDEANETLKEIGCHYYDEEADKHVNSEYEEYFFTDWETPVSLDLGEYVDIDTVNEYAGILENWGDEDTFKAACDIWGFKYVIDSNEDDYRLYPDINSRQELGEYWLYESGCYDLDKMGNLANYIDCEAFGRDIDIETDGGFTDWGYIERI